jgi:Arc/MetJ family transcription regulator
MRLTTDMDDALMAQEMEATGASTKREMVEAALKAVVRLHRLHRQKQAGMNLAGIGWEGNLDRMRDGGAPE